MTQCTHPYASFDMVSLYHHIGQPFEIPEWQCWILKRTIPKSNHFDCLGSYPILAFNPDVNLAEGLKRLYELDIVSLVFVADPYLSLPSEKMLSTFDYQRPFKTHFIYNATIGQKKLSKHHRYELRQALKQVEIRIISLSNHMNEWIALYNGLVKKHNIKGITALTQNALTDIAKLSNITTIAAFKDNQMISCHLWVQHNQHIHSFLAASNDQGYKCRASYAIYDAAIQYFSNAETINFGGCAGSIDNVNDGLAKFKAGFCNDTKMSYIFGTVIKPTIYDKLCGNLRGQIQYFPAYRSP